MMDAGISVVGQRHAIESRPEATTAATQNTKAAAARASKASFGKVADQVAAQASANGVTANPTEKDKTKKRFSLWEKADFSFGDVLDIINPLHHVPIVATLYRNLTGDQIGMAPRVIGGALWGRIGGFVAGVVNATMHWLTGKDIGDHIYAAIFGNNDPGNKSAIPQANVGRSRDLKESTEIVKEVRQAPAELLASLNKPTRRPRHQTSQITPDLDLGSTPRSSIASAPGGVLLRELLKFNRWRGQQRVEASETQRTIRLIA